MKTKAQKHLKIRKQLVLAYLRLRNLTKYRRWTMFRCLNIETTSICNRKCKFCPNKYGDREKRLMATNLFHKIINELGEMGYEGMIFPGGYGEPLLDQRIVSLVKYTREKCHQAFIVIHSNGDYLTFDLLENLIKAGMNLIVVSQYDGGINKNIKRILDQIEREKRWYKRFIDVLVRSSFTNNRAGALRELRIKKPLKKNCPLLSWELAINWKGEVLLCENDFYGRQTMGDTKRESIMKIWNNKKFRLARKLLRKKQREKIPLCKFCNCTEKDLYLSNLACWGEDRY